jgi:hypothetical protein
MNSQPIAGQSGLRDAMQAFECTGFWWLPEAPDQKVSGTLRFTEDAGLMLSLVGALGHGGPGSRDQTFPIVNGMVFDCVLGEEVILRNCGVKEMHYGSSGTTRGDYRATRAFFGGHCDTEKDLCFSDVRLEFSGLSEWASNLTGFSLPEIVATPTGESKNFVTRWASPTPHSGRLNGATISVEATGQLAMKLREYSTKEQVQIWIKSDEPASDDELNKKYVYPLQNFFTFATDHPNSVIRWDLDDLRVLSKRIFRDDNVAAELTPHKMLFTLSDVADRLVDLIGKWFEISERLRSVFNVYFAVLYKPDSFLDVKFHFVYQALELYDSSRKGSGPEESGNPTSDRELLERLLNENYQTIAPLFASSSGNAITELLRYRNFIMHRTPTSLADDPNFGRRLFWWTQRLMFLMKACFLTELGIPESLQLAWFRRNQMYQRISNELIP